MPNRKTRLLLSSCLSSGQNPAWLSAISLDICISYRSHLSFPPPCELVYVYRSPWFQRKREKNSLRSIVIIIIIKKRCNEDSSVPEAESLVFYRPLQERWDHFPALHWDRGSSANLSSWHKDNVLCAALLEMDLEMCTRARRRSSLTNKLILHECTDSRRRNQATG